MNVNNRNTFKKEERLCNNIAIEQLYREGNSIFSYPFKFVYLPSDEKQEFPVRIVISIPKRNFKHAVKRNLLRRRAKEVYRLHKSSLYHALNEKQLKLSLMLIYIEKEEKDYATIQKGILKGIEKLVLKL